MRKRIVMILLAAACATAVVMPFQVEAANTIDAKSAGYYPLVARVITVDADKNVVFFEDGNGNVWSESGAEDWQDGDLAALLMSDEGTRNIYDDRIMEAKYSAIKSAS